MPTYYQEGRAVSERLSAQSPGIYIEIKCFRSFFKNNSDEKYYFDLVVRRVFTY